MEIRIDDLTSAAVHELLREHLEGMFQHSPPESVHALDIEALREPGITFWTIWENDDLMGCGALKELDVEHGEIKSMRTAARHLRKGVARLMLNHIIEEAEKRRYKKLSLETGSMEAFEPARRLYENSGFEYCEPFADYVEDPHSVFMSREL